MRDLQKDLELCNAATPGPWRAEVYAQRVMPYICEHARSADVRFIAESREGWPEAIKRATEAEKRVQQAIHALREIVELVEQVCLEEAVKVAEDTLDELERKVSGGEKSA